METDDWALVISLFALLISGFSFVWNVWSKFIFPKPKVKVSFGIYNLVEGGVMQETSYLSLSATNFGPSAITLRAAIIRAKKDEHGRTFGFINPLHNFPMLTDHSQGPFSGGLPKKIEVGEEFSVYFPFDGNEFVDIATSIGFLDTFNRKHWAPRKSLKDVQKRFNEKKNLSDSAKG